MIRLDPKTFNLNNRVVIEEEKNTLTLVVNRKSRIIMKDGRRLLDQIRQIKKVSKKAVLIFTTAPVCSKTKSFLNSNGVEIIQEENIEKTLKKDENQGSLNIKKT